jgi:hypothetical protein
MKAYNSGKSWELIMERITRYIEKPDKQMKLAPLASQYRISNAKTGIVWARIFPDGKNISLLSGSGVSQVIFRL